MVLAPAKRFIRVGGRSVHYRVMGDGPAIVMLHDSPRSSRLHIETMRALAGQLTIYALDTPGYGNSDPLGLEDPTIHDFADALGATLAALGLQKAPIYATHTSAKIALEYVAYCTESPALVLLDGLSIPVTPSTEAFIGDYMRPFVIEATGAYLAAEWSRLRDMLRWFPWFDARLESRMPIEPPTDEWVELYALDLLSAGPHYSDAYAAAMRYDTLPALRHIGAPTIVAAREDDVLFSSLDRLPDDCGPNVTCQRLPADRAYWLDWVGNTLAAAADVEAVAATLTVADDGPVYVDLPYGQMLVHRAGSNFEGERPLLILETPTILHARIWQERLTGTRAIMMPELPGYGESDAINGATAADYADAVAAMLMALETGSIDVLAIGLAAPLALSLSIRHPDLVRRLVLDGVGDVELPERLCPEFTQDQAGGHWHRIWHMLRDGEVQWPWFDGSVAAQRQLAPCFRAEALHGALLDILKQPASYGDVALAGLSAGTVAVETLTVPVTLFQKAGDAGYSGVATLAEKIGHAQLVERPADIESAAVLLGKILNAAI